MREKRMYAVYTFSATTEAMAFEAACTRESLPGRLIPVPRAITAGCGLAWRAPIESAVALEEDAARLNLKWERKTELLL